MKLEKGLKLIYTGDEHISLQGQIITLKEKGLDGIYWTVEEFHGVYTEDYLEENYEPYIETKFKVGDLIKHIDCDKIREIVAINKSVVDVYETKIVKHSGKGVRGDGTFTKQYIEDYYELYVEEEKLSFDEYVQKISILCEEQTDLTNEISDLTESRNETLNKLHKMTESYEKLQEQLKDSVAQIDSKATKKALRKMEIANEIKELNDKLGGN